MGEGLERRTNTQCACIDNGRGPGEKDSTQCACIKNERGPEGKDNTQCAGMEEQNLLVNKKSLNLTKSTFM